MSAIKEWCSRVAWTWPALPFVSYGALLAAAYLLCSGTSWLSDTEVNGFSVSWLCFISCLAAGLCLMAAAARESTWGRRLASPRASLMGGGLSCLGALLIVAVGPYYLKPFLSESVVAVLFWSGSILYGIGLGIIALGCGRLFASVAPRQTLLYACYAQFFVGSMFFISTGVEQFSPVPGGPSLAGILSFMLLPLLAGFLAMLSHFTFPNGDDSEAVASSKPLPGSFWKFLVVLFVFALVVSSVYSRVIAASPLETAIGSSRFAMVARMAFALLLVLFLATTKRSTLHFDKLYSVLMVVSVALVASVPIVGAIRPYVVQTVSFLSIVFDMFLWCSLAFVARQKGIPSTVVFGFGYGAFQLGNGLGWLTGASSLGVVSAMIGEPFTCLIMAVVVLVCGFLLFSEHDLRGLFKPDSDEGRAIEELIAQAESLNDEESEELRPTRGRFGAVIDEIASENELSPREAEILRYVAMGYDSATMADKLFLSWNTIRTYRKNLYAKLDVHSRQELIEIVDEKTRKSG